MGSALEPVFSAVLPVFGLVACGYLAGRFGIVTQASSVALNQFVYAFALPAMLFVAVYRGSLDEILSGSFLLAVILATLATAVAGFLLSHYSGARPAESTMPLSRTPAIWAFRWSRSRWRSCAWSFSSTRGAAACSAR